LPNLFIVNELKEIPDFGCDYFVGGPNQQNICKDPFYVPGIR